MAFFPLRSFPGSVTLPPRVQQVWSAYQELDRFQWLSPPELANLQLEHLRLLLAHCYDQVPYYRRLLSEAGLAGKPIETLDDLRRLPLLTRTLVQEHQDDLTARALPAGMEAAEEQFTSGTNGVPIKVLTTDRTGLVWNACSLRDLEWCGMNPRGRLAAIRLFAKSRDELPRLLEGFTLSCWSKLLDPLMLTGISAGMDVRQDPHLQLAWLRKIDPDYLLSMPSNLEFLAGLVQESGQRLPSLKIIQAVGETLSEETRSRIETGFGAPVRNLYSTTEAGYLASSCPQGHGLHIHAENVLVEVLDADNRPCPPGETGRLVLTTLHNYRMPFVRYDLLDDVTLSPGPCPCGRGLPLLTRVDGRRHPLLYLPDGRRRAVSGLYLEIRKAGGCRQFQIIQRARDHVILRVVPDGSWQPDHAERLRRVVQDEFAAPIRVDVEEKQRLELARGCKLKIAIIEMEENNATGAPVRSQQ
jgi:phenylacetate-CoA ligase